MDPCPLCERGLGQSQCWYCGGEGFVPRAADFVETLRRIYHRPTWSARQCLEALQQSGVRHAG